MDFDFNSNIPLYQQISSQIEEGILRGSFGIGEQIPSTTEISKAYNINPATVLKGMNLLVADNILEKKRGIGMFVTSSGSDTIYQKRRNQFIQHDINKLITEAKRLGLERQELINLIERGFDNDQIRNS
ncbi:GntR family transcriptional regulator [Vagococcus intermedius]|uniref:GntR family transcriptional regulator n=1 Tax=Vagococcus intermedius TaxID=2991418 RepID=A0AAF0I4I1_9ENTE|nr:GntR family transcriptional regulator [Vagococcus intermedius]WEG72463.1 GntR family transcriptional regulator [Vagococcus intermedius]WEG74550.1 GntR family transcriptional regulator [Vagococcus intermedius]